MKKRGVPDGKEGRERSRNGMYFTTIAAELEKSQRQGLDNYWRGDTETKRQSFRLSTAREITGVREGHHRKDNNWRVEKRVGRSDSKNERACFIEQVQK